MTGCARCSDCGINYPPTMASGCCQVKGCDVRLSFISNVEPDNDWRERVVSLSAELEAARAEAKTDELRAHRVAQFERLGFPDYAAEMLADAKDATGFPLWWGRVADVLDKGATQSEALRIFA